LFAAEHWNEEQEKVSMGIGKGTLNNYLLNISVVAIAIVAVVLTKRKDGDILKRAERIRVSHFR